MGVQWTEEQKKVIDLRDRNILVSAAAGSGKTAVLVERIISLLTEGEAPLDVDRLLVVTFTEAAAAEMKDRIRSAIERKLAEEPDNAHLQNQATLIHSAQITTIHSFCLSVVRDHFPVIDLDPGFRIGEEGELKLLERDVLGELLEEEYAKGEERFLDFASAYGGGRSDRKLEDLILKTYDFSRSYPDSEGWLQSCVAAYAVETPEELEESPYVRLLKENVRKNLEDGIDLLRQAGQICQEEDGPAVYETALETDVQMLRGVLAETTYAGLGEKLSGLAFVRLPANRDKQVSQEKADRVKAVRDEVKGIVKDLTAQYFYEPVEGILEDLNQCRPAVEELARLTRRFAACFEERKRTRNLIDFSDMEQYALQILTEKKDGALIPSDTAREYQKQFYEIMIDEYQDSNLIQEAILTSISTISQGKHNVFMVGDVKQSIYRFRLSRPELFMEKYDTYAQTDGERQRIDLHRNFRSRREVLDSVNYLFRQLMTRDLGGIAYDDQAALYVGAQYPEGSHLETEVLAIDGDVGVDEAAVSDERPPAPLELEARAIAGKIRELLAGHQVLDKETQAMRPVRYGDMVILTRSIRGVADVFAEELAREGIPAYVSTREGYFSAQEVGLTLDYLRALDNRRQDLPMAAVLASPIGGLSREELARMRSAYPDLAFCQAAERYRREGEDEAIRQKLEACLGTMDRLREIVPYTPMHELLRRVLEETGYGLYASAMPGGVQRRANLEMLEEKARSFEATSYKGLFHFIRYIEQLEKYDVDYGEASTEDEQSDTVRIMTIHKSKGLEFPVVFVGGMGKRFNMQDARSSVVLHATLGAGLDAVDLERRTKSPSLIKKVIQREEVLDSLAEELRVLYVAFTRAKEKLIITGAITKPEEKLDAAGMVRLQEEEPLTFGRLSRANGYWDWLLPALARRTPEIPIRFQVVTIRDLAREEVLTERVDQIRRELLEQWDTGRIYHSGVHRSLEEQFSYAYPFAGARDQKLKFTVSELKKRIHMQEERGEQLEDLGETPYEEPEVIPLIPKFLEETEELTGASRGTAYHRVMELLDFARDYGENELEAELQRLREEGKLTGEMAACIRPGDVLRFLASEAGERSRRSAREGKLWKEQPFVLGVEARELYPGEQEGELLLVQGIIDVYFEEEDGLVVLDYKTDRVRTAGELAKKYHAQLDYYARALEQLTGKPVKEKLIYSFHLGETLAL